jgi:hypothetical protein
VQVGNGEDIGISGGSERDAKSRVRAGRPFGGVAKAEFKKKSKKNVR